MILICCIAIEAMTIEIVDKTIDSMVIFYSYVAVYQRVNNVKLALTDANTRKLMWKLPLPAFCQVHQWLSGVKTFWKHIWHMILQNPFPGGVLIGVCWSVKDAFLHYLPSGYLT